MISSNHERDEPQAIPYEVAFKFDFKIVSIGSAEVKLFGGGGE